MSAGQPELPVDEPAELMTPVPAAGTVAPPAFGRYRLVRKLGVGSYGEVWRADDLFLGEPVALKFLKSAFTGDAASLDSLKREVRTLRRLSHPNIVRVHDLVFDSRHTAIVMEYIDGRTLAELLSASPKGCLQPEDLDLWLPQLGSVFDYLHRSEGIIHSDLKPLNLMLTTTGRLKVADFGLATTLAESTSYYSRAGERIGTVAYMSPQQLQGSRPAIGDDIYSLGATLFHLLSGSPPFHGSSLDLISAEKHPPTVGARRYEMGKGKLPPVPDYWESAIAACLARDPRQRPASVRDVVRWLKPAPAGQGHSDLGTSVILPPAQPAKSPAGKTPSPPAWQPLNPPPAALPPAERAGTPEKPARLDSSTTLWLVLLVGGIVVLVALLVVALVFL